MPAPPEPEMRSPAVGTGRAESQTNHQSKVESGTKPIGVQAVPRPTSEEADDYHAVVARLNEGWRVVICAGGIQWVLQKRAGERHGRARWEGRSFCRTSEALNRLSRKCAGVIEPTAAAILASLPERIATAPRVKRSSMTSTDEGQT